MTTRNIAGIGRFIRWAFTGFNLKKYDLIIKSKKVYKKEIYGILLNILDYIVGNLIVLGIVFLFVKIAIK
jgi:hypothetical protein